MIIRLLLAVVNIFVLITCTIDDLLSIGKSEQIRYRIRYLTWFAEKYYTASQKRLFWSCRPGRELAQKFASTNNGYITDSHPGIVALFNHCKIAQRYVKNKSLLGYIVSGIYASSAKGDVHIFIGTDKIIDACGFHVGNNLWEAELPVLRRLQNKNQINNIWVHTTQPILLKSMPIWRRKWHPHLDKKVNKSLFVEDTFTQQEWDEWRLRASRPFITYGTIQKVLQKWKSYQRQVKPTTNHPKPFLL
jgi:hypothetical protein